MGSSEEPVADDDASPVALYTAARQHLFEDRHPEAIELAARALARAQETGDDVTAARSQALLEECGVGPAPEDGGTSGGPTIGEFPEQLVANFLIAENLSFSRARPGVYEVIMPLSDNVAPDGQGSFRLVLAPEGGFLQLVTWLPTKVPVDMRSHALEVINSWNATRRFPRLSLDEDGDVRIDMLVPPGAGQDAVTHGSRAMLFGCYQVLDHLVAELPWEISGAGPA
ncbi:MAG: YbjN domain-containing protein [Actinomycetota bacterium]|jgi:hypothetical protein|nr:YbjN domain-containing protein [Actinomycetota bacterium]MDA8301117.1 YbjN domain-containing protein [Actinomycetota bacterium]